MIKNQRLNLEKLGVSTYNEIQIAAIQAIEFSKNLVIYAPTGSGKTIAFAASSLKNLNNNETAVQLLVITPTRELAQQVEAVYRKGLSGLPYKINSCYGGHSIKIEQQNFQTTPQILIGTPGRIVDHIQRNNIDLSNVHTLVLDEFDKSLQMGFEEDMKFIVSTLKSRTSTLLISATKLQKNPEFLSFSNVKTLDFTTKTSNHSIQYFGVPCKSTPKEELLIELLCNLPSGKTIIFCNFREQVELLARLMRESQITAAHYHGGMEQDERERALLKFHNGSSNFLISTDLAARGLDIAQVEHVIHFQLPDKEAEFIHRSGRTGRQNNEGTVFFFVEQNMPAYLPKFETYEVVQNEPLPDEPEWTTIYISAGKKDKVNKIDIVGFFCKIGGLAKEDIGMIHVQDYQSFVALKIDKAEEIMPYIRQQKIKGKKQKIGFAR